VCPQCLVARCSGTDASRSLCVTCGKPSKRSGPDDVGRDMICCDSASGGLFHRSCVDVAEVECDLDEDGWYCAACDVLSEEERQVMEYEEFSNVDLSDHTVEALHLSIGAAISEVPVESVKRLWETRKAVLQKVIEKEGGNNYDMHWRRNLYEEHP